MANASNSHPQDLPFRVIASHRAVVGGEVSRQFNDVDSLLQALRQWKKIGTTGIKINWSGVQADVADQVQRKIAELGIELNEGQCASPTILGSDAESLPASGVPVSLASTFVAVATFIAFRVINPPTSSLSSDTGPWGLQAMLVCGAAGAITALVLKARK